MKRAPLTIICTAAVLLFCSCGSFNSNKIELYDWEREYFGDEVYSELERPCPEEEREELMEIAGAFYTALSSSFESSEKAYKALGDVLGQYAQYEPNTYREEYGTNFLTGKISGDNAYVWLEYWSEDRSALDGNIARGNGSEEYPIRVRIEAVRSENQWTIVNTNEHP